MESIIGQLCNEIVSCGRTFRMKPNHMTSLLSAFCSQTPICFAFDRKHLIRIRCAIEGNILQTLNSFIILFSALSILHSVVYSQRLAVYIYIFFLLKSIWAFVGIVAWTRFLIFWSYCMCGCCVFCKQWSIFRSKPHHPSTFSWNMGEVVSVVPHWMMYFIHLTLVGWRLRVVDWKVKEMLVNVRENDSKGKNKMWWVLCLTSKLNWFDTQRSNLHIFFSSLCAIMDGSFEKIATMLATETCGNSFL